MPITQDKLKLEDLNFWCLPKEQQEAIKASIPKRTTWELDCYRDEFGYWYFDLEDYGIHAEAFINGTQEAIDWWYTYRCGLKPDENSRMKLTVSSERHTPSNGPLYLEGEDPKSKNAHYYWDPISEKDVWLCPMLVYLFKEAPETLYTSFTPYA